MTTTLLTAAEEKAKWSAREADPNATIERCVFNTLRTVVHGFAVTRGNTTTYCHTLTEAKIVAAKLAGAHGGRVLSRVGSRR